MKAVHFDRDGGGVSPRCGNRHWSQMTAVETDVTCLTCISFMAGESCRYDVKPCGTEAAYRRHKRHGEKPHEACRRAANRAAADRKARRRSRRKVLAA